MLALMAAVCASAVGHAVANGSASGGRSGGKGVPGAGGALGAAATSILGAAWRADNSPIPQAKLRLRNVQTGRIEATAVANELGQFAFTSIESGTYVIELVSETGTVIALGHTFAIAPGETVATFVRLGSRAPWFNAIFGGGGDGFFSNAASIVSSSAASTGVTAIAPEEVRCVSPPCRE
jgi:hypothetical protein